MRHEILRLIRFCFMIDFYPHAAFATIDMLHLVAVKTIMMPWWLSCYILIIITFLINLCWDMFYYMLMYPGNETGCKFFSLKKCMNMLERIYRTQFVNSLVFNLTLIFKFKVKSLEFNLILIFNFKIKTSLH